MGRTDKAFHWVVDQQIKPKTVQSLNECFVSLAGFGCGKTLHKSIGAFCKLLNIDATVSIFA